jgi:hypothetical protein
MNHFVLAVVVAWLSSGTYNYASVDADDENDCHAKIAKIAHDRLDANENETDKVLYFEGKCIEFVNVHPPVPTPPTEEKPVAPHIPKGDEA